MKKLPITLCSMALLCFFSTNLKAQILPEYGEGPDSLERYIKYLPEGDTVLVTA